MENNSDRMGFALIALSVVAVVLLIMNTFFGPTVKGYFSGFQSWGNKSLDTINHTSDNASSANRPDESDSKWTVKSNYGTNGRFVMDKDGNAIVYAIDKSKPIEVTGTPTQTRDNVGLKTLTYVDNVMASGSLMYLFSGDSTLSSITGLDKWNIFNVYNLSYAFYNTRALTTIDLSNWDTSNVTDMSGMFNNASLLNNVGDLSNWNTSKVTAMTQMFYGANSLKSLDLSRWNISNVTSINGMFSNTGSLTQVGDLSKWNTSKVKNMSQMFSGAKLLTSLDLSKWDTSNVTDMSYMFYNSTSLTSVGDLSNWNTSKVTDMSSMFFGLRNVSTVGNISKWDTSNVSNMIIMFFNSGIKDLPSWYK